MKRGDLAALSYSGEGGDLNWRRDLIWKDGPKTPLHIMILKQAGLLAIFFVLLLQGL